MLKFFSEVHKSLFMFLQHVTSVCLNKPGVDIVLAQERSIGSAGAGLVPNPCRSPGAETISGTFLGWRCPPASLLQEQPQGIGRPGPGAALAPAAILHSKGTDTASLQPGLGTHCTFQLFYLHCCFRSWKINNKPNIYLAGISLQNPFVSQEHTCHELHKCSAHSSLEWRINGFRQSKRSWLKEEAEYMVRPALFKEHTHLLRTNG